MTSSLFLFTFSPIQSFISEARRAADLYTGSQILVELAKAAGGEIQKHAEGGKLIYPAQLSDDVPNKLVAKVPFENVEQIAQDARAALLERWRELAAEARDAFLKEAGLEFDASTWERQTADDYLWETHWSAASLDGRDYREAYDEAERGLAAAKFTRPFAQYREAGFKDTLSGKREALHGKDSDGREYWYQVGQVEKITPIKIRPSIGDKNDKRTWRARERLDAFGVIKRFHPQFSEQSIEPFNGFPSTSSIASLDYLEKVRAKIKDYTDTLSKLFGAREPLMQVRKSDKDFPYDGDFLYEETLAQKRLKDDYSIADADIKAHLQAAQTALKKLYGEFGKPSPYYAIIVLDGDGMGEYLRALDENGHTQFSADLYRFSREVRSIADRHNARVIYNGGDDVLALAPLTAAFAFARELAREFHEKTRRTASAGIALSHHLSPLGTALRAARRAESYAKENKNKNAVCIFALKRSGEPIQVRSSWEQVAPFETVIAHFRKDEVSSRLPYDAARSAYALPNADEKFESELRRLLKRHWQKGTEEEKAASARDLSLILQKWASSFPQADSPSQSEELANWLALARFIAKGGRE